MNIAIIIPVINEADKVRVAVERAWKSGADEVVLADGGSTDGTREILAELKCHYVDSLPGRAVQMNSGAAASKADVFVFVHADNWLAVDACRQIREGLAEIEFGFGGFKQRIQNDRRIFRWIESGNCWRAKWQGLIYGDQAFFIRRSLFESVDGFPEISLMEDFQLSRQLQQKSGRQKLILPGPTYVSARRWEKAGPIKQTVTNWFLSLSFRMGASPQWLAKRYRRHDQ